jgi:AcrR family transcriptional regulator
MAATADRTTPTAVPTAYPCPPTRRRGQALERAIYDAVLHQIRTVGYAGLTMEGVAACAHTGKAALYRRWAGKEELVVDTLDHVLPSPCELPDHGDVREDLLELLRLMATFLNSPAGCALESLIADIEPDGRFARLLHQRVKEPRKRMFLALLQRAADRGQVRAEAVTQLVADVGPALLMQRFSAEGPPVPDAYVVSVVDDIVLPLLRAPVVTR